MVKDRSRKRDKNRGANPDENSPKNVPDTRGIMPPESDFPLFEKLIGAAILLVSTIVVPWAAAAQKDAQDLQDRAIAKKTAAVAALREALRKEKEDLAAFAEKRLDEVKQRAYFCVCERNRIVDSWRSVWNNHHTKMARFEAVIEEHRRNWSK
ncbi:MAG: hypothetical protein BWX88_03385 [Planctomycetes bacterium ADurb.Bin126]|nr:MAG: hypothetical protein BWX88_03385 [Planctomycetes bacterium ADurb.Bin126]HOD80007.1 hypothetical protein [Phycisphaerae bacterium]HQL73096.1 hypothetical protein [Phycisphaerae bacterium]